MEEQPRGIAEPLRTVFDWQCLQSSEIDLIARAMKTGGCAVLDNLGHRQSSMLAAGCAWMMQKTIRMAASR
jgi:hypothetical protein